MGAAQLIGERFQIANLDTDLLGRGGMGAVYRATDTHTGELVAVKALDPHVVARDPELLERFTREGEALRQLNHPNIVRMIAAVEEQGRHYLVMEYVDGGSLREVLEKEGRLPAQRAVEVALEVADALTRAHHLGIIHRDLKPENVLLAADGTPRLADFGLAHVAASSRLTQTGILMGTVDYVSPEACRGEGVDERADIWSFGVLLFELLAGCLPFTGAPFAARLNAILTQPVPDLSALAPGVPDGLADLVYRMLEKDRCQRIPSVRLVGAELEAVQKNRPSATPTTAAPLAAAESRFSSPTPSPAGGRGHNLPVQTTPFVGRQAELVEVGRLLEDPAVRLVTLVGLGGMGKTRLALEAGSAQVHRSGLEQGVYWVSLAPVNSPNEMVPAIAEVLGLRFREGSEPRQQLLSYLREKQMLLILDNLEHLVAGVDLLTDILGAAAGVRVLTTSRVRLGLPEEHAFSLGGLDLPDWPLHPAEMSVAPAPDSSHIQQAMQASAVKLFLQSARRVDPRFELAAGDLHSVVRICRLVEGMPLGILLAAAWIEMLSPAEIAAEMEHSLDFLATDGQQVPKRQRSMRAVFDYTWAALADRERAIFRTLAVFHGGFAREAVQQVSGASLRELLGLVNRSLLHRTPTGRYEVHELVWQYAAEKLAAASAEEEVARDHHAAYYAAFMADRGPALRGMSQSQPLAQIAPEANNVRAAWDWALARGRLEDLERILDPLADFCRLCGWYREGETLFSRAAQQMAGASELRARLLFGKVQLQQGRFTNLLGNDVEADRLLTASLALFRELEATPEIAHALCLLGGAESLYGAPRREHCLEGLALYREIGDRRGTAAALQGLAWCAWCDEEHAEAKLRFQDSLALFRQVGDPEGMTRCMHGLGHTCWILGEYGQGEQIHTEMLRLCQDTGNRGGTARALGDLGIDVYGLRQYAKAYELLAQSLALYRDMGDMAGVTDELGDLAEAANLLGDYAAAERYAREVVAFVESWFAYRVLGNAARGLGNYVDARAYLCRSLQVTGRPGRYLWPLLGVAQLLACQGEKERALELLSLIMNHRMSWQVVKDQARLLAVELEAELSPDVAAAAQERGRARDLKATVAELLAEWGEPREPAVG